MAAGFRPGQTAAIRRGPAQRAKRGAGIIALRRLPRPRTTLAREPKGRTYRKEVPELTEHWDQTGHRERHIESPDPSQLQERTERRDRTALLQGRSEQLDRDHRDPSDGRERRAPTALRQRRERTQRQDKAFTRPRDRRGLTGRLERTQRLDKDLRGRWVRQDRTGRRERTRLPDRPEARNSTALRARTEFREHTAAQDRWAAQDR